MCGRSCRHREFKRLEVVRNQAAGTTQHGDNDDLSEEILQPRQGVSPATLLKIVSCLCLLSVVKSENIQRLQREEYERLMGDVEWVETVLKPYVAAKWNELE